MKSGVELNEVSVADTLRKFRESENLYVCPSFGTISGYGHNGAIIHYSASKSDAATIGTDAPFLCDSGGQYLDGTTDVTRTMHYGTPTAHHRRCYTRVLQVCRSGLL